MRNSGKPFDIKNSKSDQKKIKPLLYMIKYSPVCVFVLFAFYKSQHNFCTYPKFSHT